METKKREKIDSVCDYLSICEVAHMIGVCENTIRAHIKDGTIKAVKFVGVWRIRKDHLDAAIESLGRDD